MPPIIIAEFLFIDILTKYHLKKILIFTVNYNEVENIYTLIIKIKKFNSHAHILIIDYNTQDGTTLLIRSLKKI